MWDHLYEALSTLAIALVTWVVTTAVHWWHRRQERAKRSHPAHSVGLITEMDLEICIRLDRALFRWRAQRAYLSKFHNGDSYVDGSDILKKSRTHERVRKGVSYQAEAFRGTLTSTMPEEMKLVLADGPSYTEVDQIPPSKFRWLCESGGARAVARCAVHKGEEIVGFVGLDFDGDAPVKPADIEELCDVAREVGGLLAGYAARPHQGGGGK